MTSPSANRDNRRTLGAAGERLAALYLEQRGYQIIARNVRLRGGELDIVARDGDCLVFVEVRLRHAASSGVALESITPAKRRRLRFLLAQYCSTLPEQPAEVRIDVVGLCIGPRGTLDEVALVKNAVEDE
ncbi:MAG: YraN family protein [Dehalococcoidia bacterium]